MNRALITGASGFIGQHLAEMMILDGWQVTCLVRHRSRSERLQEIGCRLAYGDVTDFQSVRDALTRSAANHVFHLAGLTKSTSSQRLYRTNGEGSRNLLKAAQQQETPPTVILVSSLAAAGPSTPDRARQEADDPRPVSYYGKSKLAAELAAHEFRDTVPITVIRPPIVLGPGDRDGLEMFKSVAHWGVHMVPVRETMLVSWIDVRDLSMALIEVACRGRRLDTHKRGQGIYFAAASESPDYADLGNELAAALGRTSVRVIRNPTWAVWFIAGVNEVGARVRGRPHIFGLDKAREATAGSWICNADKLRREINFQCRLSLRETLTSTAQWYRKEGWI